MLPFTVLNFNSRPPDPAVPSMARRPRTPCTISGKSLEVENFKLLEPEPGPDKDPREAVIEPFTVSACASAEVLSRTVPLTV